MLYASAEGDLALICALQYQLGKDKNLRCRTLKLDPELQLLYIDDCRWSGVNEVVQQA